MIIDPDSLSENLGAYVVVDCRWSHGDPEAGRAGYEAGHIPGASFLNVEKDLSAPPGGANGGRHPLPSLPQFERAAAKAGITNDSQVVAYDEHGEAGAARLWWLLRHFGHDDAAVLDGGLKAWVAVGGELETGPPPDRSGSFTARPRTDDTITAEEIASDPDLLLLDARAPERYRGEREPIDAVAGHIPGALNAPFTALAPDGRFLPRDELAQRLGPEGAEIVAYCGSGVTAGTIALAAELTGRRARLYPGSWSEWSARGLPVE